MLILCISGLSGQEKQPWKVDAQQVCIQLDMLFTQDGLTKQPADETISIAKSVLLLNHLQLDYYELKNDSDPNVSALSKDNGDFASLRKSICEQRPTLKLIDLDGRLKPCR
jgi:hypothetical protein